jgi:DNA-binding NarL/FixJ family response regulator
MNGCQLAELEPMEMSDSSEVEVFKIRTSGDIRKELARGVLPRGNRHFVAIADHQQARGMSTLDASSSRFCLTCLAFGCEHMRLAAKYRPLWLNWREIQIIRRLAVDGCANKIAAFELGLTEATVKLYLFQLGKKLRAAGFLSVANRTALVAWAVEHLPGLIEREN